MSEKSQIESRKKDHVELILRKGAQYAKTSGFERVEFIHNALPEMSLDSVDLSTSFLGRKLRVPIMISAMTGGYKDAKAINRALAAGAQKHGLALGLGSQRAMIEHPSLKETYAIRDVAPDVPLLANIGAVQLKKYPISKIETLVSAVDADGLAIHLNPLQEAIQPEGDKDFSGILDAITKTVERLTVPIVVKETGAGISQDVAFKLMKTGVRYIDIAGSGGTSWSAVEYMRKSDNMRKSDKGPSIPGFEDWGISTFESLMQCRGTSPLIASGGIRNGIDGAKALALGAELWGAAYPFLKAQRAGKLNQVVKTYVDQTRLCAYLSGSKTLAELRKAKVMIR